MPKVCVACDRTGAAALGVARMSTRNHDLQRMRSLAG